jgi:hypothetical protein
VVLWSAIVVLMIVGPRSAFHARYSALNLVLASSSEGARLRIAEAHDRVAELVEQRSRHAEKSK